jgi:hypothetical protein
MEENKSIQGEYESSFGLRYNMQWSFEKNPRLVKQMKKAYGQNLGRYIAFGRKFTKLLKEKYASHDSNPTSIP